MLSIFTETLHSKVDYYSFIHILLCVKSFFRFLIISGICSIGANIFGSFVSYAADEKDILNVFNSGNSISGSTHTVDGFDTKKDEENIDVTKKQKEVEKENVKQDLNEYIIEAYKAQGTKIIKELDIKLQKTLPDNEKRKEAYIKIMSALELRKKKISKNETSEVKKVILSEFLNHMIDGL